jgi:S-adenosylmethionine hydrolase
MSVITLTTDFGLKDGNVGAMKGVILSIAPGTQIADISHFIAPQDIAEASLVISRAAGYFPAGTIHVVVVDPGVGTNRRPIAGQVGEQYVVGPDNGVFTRLVEAEEAKGSVIRFYHLAKSEFWLPKLSTVFHGRDIFAPVAAHLAKGVALEEMGEPITDLVRLKLPRPVSIVGGLQGEVIHIDHFGNISSSILREDVGKRAVVQVELGGQVIDQVVHTFGERPSGTLVALFGSTDYLLVCEVNGSAAKRLGVKVGDPFVARLGEELE